MGDVFLHILQQIYKMALVDRLGIPPEVDNIVGAVYALCLFDAV